MDSSNYTEQILAKRAEREKRLLANPRNWFSLAGLYCLEQGENRFGSATDNQIVLPTSPAPYCGSFCLNGETVTLKQGNATLKVNDQPPADRPLQNDHTEKPDFISCGSLILLVLRRGEKTMLRVWDTESSSVKNFHGLNYFPIQPEYCLEASYVAHEPPVIKKSTNVIGSELEIEFLGQARFTINSVECVLEAQEEDDGLLFHFSDLTRKDTTYPGGRLLLANAPVDGKVTLDFNLATNWPCAYTTFATCPLTPFENALQVRIEAGEKRYHE
jgi:uncharacterized protein (DUF1684 family)